MTDMKQRETLGSRLGFILLSAGCAIGLGNIWRFPYVCGNSGGAFFVLFYIVFLILLGFPVMMMELAMGRASHASLCVAYEKLKKKKSRIPWKGVGVLCVVANGILLMFYTVLTGWLLYYVWLFISRGISAGADGDAVNAVFNGLRGSWRVQTLCMSIALGITLLICSAGLRNGAERCTKWMMAGLFLLLFVLAFRVCLLPHAGEGLSYFLRPNLDKLQEIGLFPVLHAAMTQAFFSLSVGMGGIAIFGSYTSKKNTLAKETFLIILLDTIVAICAGFIIFPLCSFFGVSADCGPSLVFLTLPRLFLNMKLGNVWSVLFFVFLSIAALTTLIAVVESIAAYWIDNWHFSRGKAICLTGILLFVLSFPCILGFNLWAGFTPFGEGTCVLDLEDFLVSDNALPLGSLAIVLFCMGRHGWGSEASLAEINTGDGPKIDRWTLPYLRYILPLIVFSIWAIGICKRFH